MIRLDNIKIFEDISEEQVISKALKKNRIDQNDVIEVNIVKKSIDARDKNNINFIYSVKIKIDENTHF